MGFLVGLGVGGRDGSGVGWLVGSGVGFFVGFGVGDFDGGGVCKFTVLLGAGVLTDTVGDGVGGLVVGRVVGGFVGKGVGKGVLSPGHGGHTDELGEGGGVEVSGTPGQSFPSHGGEGGGVVGDGVTPPGVNGCATGASVRTGSMEEQIVGDGDWVEVVSMPSFLLPREDVGGQVHPVGGGVISVPSLRLVDGTHFSLLEIGFLVGLLVLHAGTEAEGLAELGVMEGELVPLVIPGTAVGFVNVRIVGNGVGKGGAVKK